jgi:beta-galactosidase
MTVVHPLNDGWMFRQLGGSVAAWTEVSLPHSPFVADLDGRDHWFGECEYRRRIEVPAPTPPGARCVLFIGAAMHTTRVMIEGHEIAVHRGGYLPFEVDLTTALQVKNPCDITLRLDNRDDADIPPGKVFEDLDFCWYGGLYRAIELRLIPPIYITDAISAGVVAGGGVFLRTLEVSDDRAVIAATTHVHNNSFDPCPVRVRISFQYGGREVARATSDVMVIPAKSALPINQSLTIERPALWSPASPALHEVVVTLLAADGRELDRRGENFGIRRIAFSRSQGFVINGHRLRLRGTNRHQEYPHVGYAVPRAAQYRDAIRIKEAGFDYVRLSHYPQSPDFLQACDELGIVVMNCIPGWQFIGGPYFRAACYQAARELIRRDRNHACVVLWELSLNETEMDEAFMARLHAIGHEEYPGDQFYTCGWIDRYDVFSHSRQHGEIHRWANGDKALVIAEYGDWEYFARNQGFDQKSGAGVFDRWSTARQRRADGERGLRQQVSHHVLALNDTLASPAVLDGQWAVFDYARGYDPNRAAVGVMDVHRLPKFSYFFYRSQRGPAEGGRGWTGGAGVFIASHWTPASDLRIPVFSNCEEVELWLNGTVIARRRPAQTALTQHLPHPPFYFDLPRFTPGTLEAIGYIRGKAQASHVVATPAPFHSVDLMIDDLNFVAASTEPDLLCAHAYLRDASGTLCIDELSTISFSVSGHAEIVGLATVTAEAGIASIVLRVPSGKAGFTLYAHPEIRGRATPASLAWPPATRELATIRPQIESVPFNIGAA